jgi:YD repeat-containing protein
MSETMQEQKLKSVRKYASKLRQVNFGAVEVDDQSRLVTEVHYGENGKVSKEIRYNSNGQQEEIHEYAYDDKDRLLEHRNAMPLDDVEEHEKTEHDDKGRVIREVKMYGDDEGESAVYEYDDAGRLKALKRYDEEGKCTEEEEMQYDAEGRMSMRIVKDHHAGKTTEIDFIYNSEGKLQEQVEKENGKTAVRTVFEYDAAGHDVSVAQYNASGNLAQKVESEFDEEGRLIKRISRGFYTRIYNYRYDDSSRLTDETVMDENNNVISRHAYEYDDQGRVALETIYEMDPTHSGRGTTVAHRFEYENYGS